MIVGIWGPEKGWKSSAALSFPKPMAHFDLDVGGFERAAWRLADIKIVKREVGDPITINSDLTNIDIITKPYPTPIQMEKLMGIQKEGISIKFPKKIVGVKETWQNLVIDYVTVCQNTDIKTIVLDSATQCWLICHRAYLQELQERQVYKWTHTKDGAPIANRNEKNFPENDYREKLQPMEYAEPNDRMRTLIYTARSYNKHLILTHYPRPVYAQRVGEKGIEEYKTDKVEPDGFKDTRKLVDIEIWVEPDAKGEVTATITTCGLEGLGTKATGLSIEPSYQGILNLKESFQIQ